MTEPTRIPPRRTSRGNAQYLLSALLLVLVAAALLGMYFYLEAQKKENQAVLELISQKVEVIEDKLSITNEDSVQNMETMTDQIAFLDTEVRKLWGHRKGYQENFRKQESKASSNEENIQQLSSKTTKVEDKLDGLDEKIQLAEDLQLKITILTNEINKQKKALSEHAEALSAIDQYRIQNNQKLTEILTRLNNLSDELDEIILVETVEGL